MKNLFLIFTLMMGASLLHGQAPKSCCSTADTEAESPIIAFAKFADDENFRNQHPVPEEIDFVGEGEVITFETPDKGKSNAYALLHESATSYLFVIHEWWGLNDHVKQEADRLSAELGNTVNVIALDMYDGKVAKTPENARKYMQAVKSERAEAIILGAKAYVDDSTARIATIGWCFGGGWSLKASLLLGEQGAGCVIYYGMPVTDAEQLKTLNSDVLGLFASDDGWITSRVVDEFAQAMGEAGKQVENHTFEAEHAFANPSRPSYNEEAAAMANAMAMTYLIERLKK